MKINCRIILLIIFTLIEQHLFCQREYIDEVFEIVQENSINKNSINFDKLKKEAYSRLRAVDSIEDCYPIVKFILSELKDKHSFFMDKNAVVKWKNTSKEISTNDEQHFNGKKIQRNIGYITLSGFGSGDPVALTRYADHLQELIKSLDSKKIIGWIIDLRKNTGGNCWPMLTGLGPILGDGVCGFFVNAEGEKKEWYYKEGESGMRKGVCKVSNPPYIIKNKNNPVAILTGPQTASSGEVVVTSFRGMHHAKSFGESTAGLSTGNANFSLSDGSQIFLTTSVYADRNETLYGDKIPPDILVHFNYNEIGKENDPVIIRAIEWIKTGG